MHWFSEDIQRESVEWYLKCPTKVRSLTPILFSDRIRPRQKRAGEQGLIPGPIALPYGFISVLLLLQAFR
jgi:hypothetical protein